MTDVKIGVFSEMSVRYTGTLIYRTPSGEEVEVTAVVDNPEYYRWSDKKVVGVVTEFVRCGRQSVILRAKSRYEDDIIFRRG